MRPYNTTVEWTPLAAYEIPLRIHNHNSCLMLLWWYSPFLSFSFALHISNIMHTPIFKQEAFENPLTQSEISLWALLQFRHSIRVEFAACQFAKSAHPLWVWGSAQNFAFSTSLHVSWWTMFHRLCVCMCVYLHEWCVLAHRVFFTARFVLNKSHPLSLSLSC